MAKYLVYAGCDNEGQMLNGQPYDGPLDSNSVAEFALETLRNSIYARSNTAWGLGELDWDCLEDASGEGGPVYFATDDAPPCKDEDVCGSACQCSEEYWVAVSINE